jgi:hypothetical protein
VSDFTEEVAMTVSPWQGPSALAVVVAALLVSLALVAAALLAPPAYAQCGTQMSSCRNCHEVRGQLKVNTKGEWHTTHAFGDFCVTCHGGDAKAKDADPAHAGMMTPLQNVTAACATCHPTDLKARADKFAAILGVSAQLGSGAPVVVPAPASAGRPGPAAISAAVSCGPIEGVAVGSIVDYNRLAVADSGANWGNVTLVALIAAMSLLWAGLAIGSWIRSARKRVATATAARQDLPIRSAVADLLPALAQSDEATLAALSALLRQEDKQGARALEALGSLTPEWLAVATAGDPKDLALALAVARQSRS